MLQSNNFMWLYIILGLIVCYGSGNIIALRISMSRCKYFRPWRFMSFPEYYTQEFKNRISNVHISEANEVSSTGCE